MILQLRAHAASHLRICFFSHTQICESPSGIFFCDSGRGGGGWCTRCITSSTSAAHRVSIMMGSFTEHKTRGAVCAAKYVSRRNSPFQRYEHGIIISKASRRKANKQLNLSPLQRLYTSPRTGPPLLGFRIWGLGFKDCAPLSYYSNGQ